MNCNRSAERLAELLSWQGADGREQLVKAGEELFYLIPELRAEEGFVQNNPYHVYDVWNHTVEALRWAEPDITVRLAVLLHDVGKPACYTEDEWGTGHFYGHGAAGARIAGEALARLGFEESAQEMVTQLVRYHDAQIHGKCRSVNGWLNQLGGRQFGRLLEIQRCDILGQNPQRIKERIQRIDRLKAMLEEAVIRSGRFGVKDLAIGGRELIGLGYAPGRELGQTLRALAELAGQGKLENSPQALLREAGLWLEQNCEERNN